MATSSVNTLGSLLTALKRNAFDTDVARRIEDFSHDEFQAALLASSTPLIESITAFDSRNLITESNLSLEKKKSIIVAFAWFQKSRQRFYNTTDYKSSLRSFLENISVKRGEVERENSAYSDDYSDEENPGFLSPTIRVDVPNVNSITFHHKKVLNLIGKHLFFVHKNELSANLKNINRLDAKGVKKWLKTVQAIHYLALRQFNVYDSLNQLRTPEYGLDDNINVIVKANIHIPTYDPETRNLYPMDDCQWIFDMFAHDLSSNNKGQEIVNWTELQIRSVHYALQYHTGINNQTREMLSHSCQAFQSVQGWTEHQRLRLIIQQSL